MFGESFLRRLFGTSRERDYKRYKPIVEAVASHDDWEFLSDFYRQQRQYLESRQLFGDAREDKFHDKANVAGAAKPSR